MPWAQQEYSNIWHDVVYGELFNKYARNVLRFFESFHGQYEGDSVHSAINTAIERAGDLSVPSHLSTIFALARRKRPYKVKKLEHYVFLNFKKFSQDLKNVSLQTNNQNLEFPVNWKKVTEMKVVKSKPSTIFFKTSHLEE